MYLIPWSQIKHFCSHHNLLPADPPRWCCRHKGHWASPRSSALAGRTHPVSFSGCHWLLSCWLGDGEPSRSQCYPAQMWREQLSASFFGLPGRQWSTHHLHVHRAMTELYSSQTLRKVIQQYVLEHSRQKRARVHDDAVFVCCHALLKWAIPARGYSIRYWVFAQ